MRSVVAALAFLCAMPASAQIFWQAPDYSGPPLTGYEDGMGVPLPGATPAEQKAAIIWNVRSGLNVAALQCGFEPSLRTAENYNAVLSNHGSELNAAYATLTSYFKRNNSDAKAAQKALDTFGTKTYSSFSTVNAQYGFCTAAGRVSRIALFTPRGRFGTLAEEHLREMRNALKPSGEQQFRATALPPSLGRIPSLDKKCWKKDRYNAKKCGPI